MLRNCLPLSEVLRKISAFTSVWYLFQLWTSALDFLNTKRRLSHQPGYRLGAPDSIAWIVPLHPSLHESRDSRTRGGNKPSTCFPLGGLVEIILPHESCKFKCYVVSVFFERFESCSFELKAGGSPTTYFRPGTLVELTSAQEFFVSILLRMLCDFLHVCEILFCRLPKIIFQP